MQVHIHMIDGFCVAIKEDGGDLKPCAPELFNVPKDVIHIGYAPAPSQRLPLAGAQQPDLAPAAKCTASAMLQGLRESS